MAFKIFTKWAAEQRAKFMEHVGDDFLVLLREATKDGTQKISDKQVAEIFDKRGLNSFEREIMYPHLDTAELLREAIYCLGQCSRHDHKRPASTYDDAIMLIFLPLLIDRMRQAEGIEGKPLYEEPLSGGMLHKEAQPDKPEEPDEL